MPVLFDVMAMPMVFGIFHSNWHFVPVRITSATRFAANDRRHPVQSPKRKLSSCPKAPQYRAWVPSGRLWAAFRLTPECYTPSNGGVAFNVSCRSPAAPFSLR